jgi:hypothetical protein
MIAMKSRDATRLAAVVAMAVFVSECFGGEDSRGGDLPTPEQLVSIVLASKAQYRSFDLEFTVKRYGSTNGTWASRPEGTAVHRFRTDFDRIYSRAVITEQDVTTGQPYMVTNTVAIGRTSSRKLLEQGGVVPQGVVKRGRRMASELELNPVDATWTPYGQEVWTKTRNSNAVVRRAPKEGCLILESKCFDGQTRIIIIDARHGYLPVRQEIITSAGRPVMSCELSDLRQVNDGLWFPFQYVAELSGEVKYKSVFKVSKASVNVALKAAELDLVFPRGTFIRDEVTDLSYEVGKDPTRAEDLSMLGAAPLRDITPATIAATQPTTDSQLEQASRGVQIEAKGGMRLYRWRWVVGGSLLFVLAVCYIGMARLRQRQRRRKR